MKVCIILKTTLIYMYIECFNTGESVGSSLWVGTDAAENCGVLTKTIEDVYSLTNWNCSEKLPLICEVTSKGRRASIQWADCYHNVSFYFCD